MFRAFAVVCLVFFIAPAQAGTAEEKAAQQELVANLQIRDNQLDAEIRDLANGRIGRAAQEGLAAKAELLADKIGRLTTVSEELGAVNEDFPALRQQVAGEPVLTFIDLSIDSSQDAAWQGLRKILEMAIKKRAPNAKAPESEAFAFVGIFMVNDINEWTIRDMVRGQEARLIDVLRLIQTFRMELGEERQKLARVQELRQQQSKNFQALERERARLAEMQ